MKPDECHRIETLARALRYGESASQDELDALVAEWEPRAQPSHAEREERYAVVRADGSATGAVAPRWLAHLFGLRHRAVHVGLCTRQGMVLLQRRNGAKRNWPGALDMAVAGHVPLLPEDQEPDLISAAWKEAAEEIGLGEERAAETLLEGCLTLIDGPYASFDAYPNADPPFFNAEARYLYAATLSDSALSSLQFRDNEVEALLLAPPETCWRMMETESIASGLRYSLPRYLSWLARHPQA